MEMQSFSIRPFIRLCGVEAVCKLLIALLIRHPENHQILQAQVPTTLFHRGIYAVLLGLKHFLVCIVLVLKAVNHTMNPFFDFESCPLSASEKGAVKK